MPTENKPAEPGFNLNTPDGGRGYIAHLFKTVLRRHDYRQYIAERLAGDFACTLAQHFEEVKAREQAMQLRLNAADQRIDELTAQHQSEPAAYIYTCTFDKYQEPVVRHSHLRVTHATEGWIEEPLYRYTPQ